MEERVEQDHHWVNIKQIFSSTALKETDQCAYCRSGRLVEYTCHIGRMDVVRITYWLYDPFARGEQEIPCSAVDPEGCEHVCRCLLSG